jgi:hypothetical protein
VSPLICHPKTQDILAVIQEKACVQMDTAKINSFVVTRMILEFVDQLLMNHVHLILDVQMENMYVLMIFAVQGRILVLLVLFREDAIKESTIVDHVLLEMNGSVLKSKDLDFVKTYRQNVLLL